MGYPRFSIALDAISSGIEIEEALKSGTRISQAHLPILGRLPFARLANGRPTQVSQSNRKLPSNRFGNQSDHVEINPVCDMGYRLHSGGFLLDDLLGSGTHIGW